MGGVRRDFLNETPALLLSGSKPSRTACGARTLPDVTLPLDTLSTSHQTGLYPGGRVCTQAGLYPRGWVCTQAGLYPGGPVCAQAGLHSGSCTVLWIVFLLCTPVPALHSRSCSALRFPLFPLPSVLSNTLAATAASVCQGGHVSACGWVLE